MICLVLSYYETDFHQAMELGRFIAQIEPAKREDVRFRFVARWDAPRPEPDVLSAVGQKFDVSFGRTETQWTGWPSGPNAMARDILSGAKAWLHECGWSEVSALLLLEPDCVPLQKGWLTRILNEWQLAAIDGAVMMGSWRNSGTEFGHINGNAVIAVEHAPKLAKLIDKYLAWDVQVVPYTRTRWHIAGCMRNDFSSTGATEEILRTPEVGAMPPCLSHGWKDDSAMKIARKWCL